MRSLRLLPFLVLVGAGSALAQSPTYGVGRTPSAEEIRAWDISISPTGEELPPGRGTAEEGAQVYMLKACFACHGMAGVGEPAPRLIKREAGPDADPWSLGRVLPFRSPYATTVWDFHQSRHASGFRRNPHRRRGLRAYGLSALPKRCHRGGRGNGRRESADGGDAQS